MTALEEKPFSFPSSFFAVIFFFYSRAGRRQFPRQVNPRSTLHRGVAAGFRRQALDTLINGTFLHLFFFF